MNHKENKPQVDISYTGSAKHGEEMKSIEKAVLKKSSSPRYNYETHISKIKPPSARKVPL